MASIKAIEALSVHRIQSGQVIVDLCSVVKELVENSIDAGATSVEVRFKNQGLDAIEVADNGAGIAQADHASVALKHHTSKLRSYDDLARLDTFGFRGEALSSLCAVAAVRVVTAQAHEAPRATRLDFAATGELRESVLVAGLKGTTVSVEDIFKPLPVRRQELARNIKREYAKVLNLLQAYACISTTARITVSNVAAKGKKTIVFATKAHQSTRENIANVFGTKTTASLIPLSLDFEMQATGYHASNSKVRVTGHVSKPVVGEGRQMADRQMFFVNGRPCALPQVAKAMNEVYKTFNLTQSPFIFANLELDTNAYDVNVSPDKRTILLHEQGALLESLKSSLLNVFEDQDQTVPSGRADQPSAYSAFKRSSLAKEKTREASGEPDEAEMSTSDIGTALHSKFAAASKPLPTDQTDLVQKIFTHKARDRPEDAAAAPAPTKVTTPIEDLESEVPTGSQQVAMREEPNGSSSSEARHNQSEMKGQMNVMDARDTVPGDELFVRGDERPPEESLPEEPIPAVRTVAAKYPPGPVPNAFDRMRPLKTPMKQATITIGDQTMIKTIGGPSSLRWTAGSNAPRSKAKVRIVPTRSKKPSFQNSLREFAAPGTQVDLDDPISEDDEVSEEDPEPPRKLTKRDTGSDEELQPRKTRSKPVGVAEDAVEGDEGEQDTSDGEYLDDEAKRAREDAKVVHLIEEAEKTAAEPSDESIKRASRLLKGAHRDATTKLQLPINDTTQSVLADSRGYYDFLQSNDMSSRKKGKSASALDISAEEKLSLTIAKQDFEKMEIAGQFNLGFIIALRPASIENKKRRTDELFIIDQHASDEKYNFERLQAVTQVQNQPLVHHQRLDLTAVEEEILLENQDALIKNGFEVEVDESGAYPVGKRCTLVSLPMSKEVTFSTEDLEELIALLAENPVAQLPTQSSMSLTPPAVPSLNRERSSFITPIVRPSKVRKMFAMRACRSSVMIGKTLGHKQMRGLVDNMGKMDKPWNCPHGRPTMRHLYSFADWKGWDEHDDMKDMMHDDDDDDDDDDDADHDAPGSSYLNDGKIDWASYLGDGEPDDDDEGQDEEESDDQMVVDQEEEDEDDGAGQNSTAYSSEEEQGGSQAL